jgi:selenocysteine lyase/cysteine desulfurase
LAALRGSLAPAAPEQPRLFAYPAQSNFTGVQHPLEWIEVAQAQGWDVLLDAASFVPTNRLDLGRWRPDFVPLSFYKLFGYPTGVGCLVARRAALARLRRPWFAGGTITISSVRGDGHFLAEGEAGFEDGTINYLNLPAVEIGLRHLASVGVDTVHERVRCLTGWLLGQLAALRHRGGGPLIQVYGPATTEGRGGTVNFNVLKPDGRVVDFRLVEAAANERTISLRTGCFCNPGAREAALGWSAAEMGPLFRRGRRLTLYDLHDLWPGRAIGAVRVSLGIATTPGDIARLIEFLRSFAD